MRLRGSLLVKWELVLLRQSVLVSAQLARIKRSASSNLVVALVCLFRLFILVCMFGLLNQVSVFGLFCLFEPFSLFMLFFNVRTIWTKCSACSDCLAYSAC